MAIKSLQKARELQTKYTDSGKTGWSPAVRRYLMSNGILEKDEGYFASTTSDIIDAFTNEGVITNRWGKSYQA